MLDKQKKIVKNLDEFDQDYHQSNKFSINLNQLKGGTHISVSNIDSM